MMDSFSKLKFTSENYEDRISGLPDHVLSQILSFLPTKYAVLTSVLSSRWRHIWTSIHFLNFDKVNFYKNNVEIFESFVSQVMNCCSSKTIHEFRLSYIQPPKICMSRLHDWVHTVADRNIEKIEIEVSENRGLQLPNNLFTCNSLVSLTLRLDSAFSVPAVSICFPSLKFLRISLEHPSSEIAKQLFSSCPALEYLSIYCGSGDEVKMTFNITAPRLKTLRICFYMDGSIEPEYNLLIDAPLLEYLCVEDQNLVCCIKDPFPSLKKAILDVGDYGFDINGSLEVLCPNNLLRAVANTKYLSLSFQTTMVLRDEHIPFFSNLTTLKLEMYEFVVVKMLPMFLQGSPNLEDIILDMDPYGGDEANYKRRFKWMCNPVPASSFHHLRVVKILSFGGRPMEWDVIEYILVKAGTLQNLIVRAEDRNRTQKQKTLDRLSKFLRASEACVVEVC